MTTRELIGHSVGVLVVLLTFLSYQARTKNRLLVIQTTATALNALQYLLIGAASGAILNVVCVTRNLVFFHRDKAWYRGLFFPILFACLMPVTSLLTWDGIPTLLVMAGLAINTVCLGICDPQGLRKSILLTSTLILIYNLIVRSYSGLFNESVALVSSIIGLIRYRNIAEKPDTPIQ